MLMFVLFTTVSYASRRSCGIQRGISEIFVESYEREEYREETNARNYSLGAHLQSEIQDSTFRS